MPEIKEKFIGSINIFGLNVEKNFMDDYGKVQRISKKEEININIIQNKNCIGLFVQETKMHK